MGTQQEQCRAAAKAPLQMAQLVSGAVIPNGLSTGLDIGFSNYSLARITLSFYTMCKSTTPIFLLGFCFLWGLERCVQPPFSCSLMQLVVLIMAACLPLSGHRTSSGSDGRQQAPDQINISGLHAQAELEPGWSGGHHEHRPHAAGVWGDLLRPAGLH